MRIVLGRGSMTRVLPLGFPATGYSWHFNPTATPPLPTTPWLTKNTISQDLGTVKQNYTCRSGKPSHCLESKFTPELPDSINYFFGFLTKLLHCTTASIRSPANSLSSLLGVCAWPGVKALSLNDHLRAAGLGPNLNWGKTRSVTLERLDSPVDGDAMSTVADTQSGKSEIFV